MNGLSHLGGLSSSSCGNHLHYPVTWLQAAEWSCCWLHLSLVCGEKRIDSGENRHKIHTVMQHFIIIMHFLLNLCVNFEKPIVNQYLAISFIIPILIHGLPHVKL